MNTEEKISLFNLMWNLLIFNIGNSRKRFRNKKAILLSDFYFTRAKLNQESKGYSCIVCYKNWEDSTVEPDRDIRRIKTVILRQELLNYFLNGWNKTEEVKSLLKIYHEYYQEKEYLEETKQCWNSTYYEVCKNLRHCKAEKDILMYEKKCVNILIKHMNLNKIK